MNMCFFFFFSKSVNKYDITLYYIHFLTGQQQTSEVSDLLRYPLQHPKLFALGMSPGESMMVGWSSIASSPGSFCSGLFD